MSIKMALKQCQHSKFRFRLGAVITKGGRVLGTGHNITNSYSPLNPHPFKDSIHAEVKAILSVLKRGNPNSLKGASLYVARYSSTGPRLARPCSFCMAFAQEVGISKVIYTTNEGYNHEERI